MLCLFQCQSDSALTRTYWSSRGTAGRNSRFKLFLLLILGAFSFVLSAILNSQASYRCTLVPRLPFPVPRSPFLVPRSPFPVPRSPFPILVTSLRDVKISAKSNKGQENQTKLDFVIDSSLKCLSKHRNRPLLIATEKPMRLFRPKTSQKPSES